MISKAQAEALSKLNAGTTVYAYSGVSRATAFALVRQGLAAWSVKPHLVEVRRTQMTRRAGSRFQLEWGLVKVE